MGPKKQPEQQPTAPSSTEALEQKIEDLLRTFNSRFDNLERMLNAVTKENQELRATLKDRDEELYRMKERLNEQEQYARNWSVRVLNLRLPKADATQPIQVMRHVYNNVLLPILEGARDDGEIDDIPSCDSILETAHILPSKQDKIPPIICRFYNRNVRALIFRMKKKHAIRDPPEPRQKMGKFTHPIYEDLTRPNFNKYLAVSKTPGVTAVWTINGSIRYKMENDENVYKVQKVFEPFQPGKKTSERDSLFTDGDS